MPGKLLPLGTLKPSRKKHPLPAPSWAGWTPSQPSSAPSTSPPCLACSFFPPRLHVCLASASPGRGKDPPQFLICFALYLLINFLRATMQMISYFVAKCIDLWSSWAAEVQYRVEVWVISWCAGGGLMKMYPWCHEMEKSQSNKYVIFSCANLSSEDLILLTCTVINLELFLDLTAVTARLGSDLIFSEQNPFCAAMFAQHLAQWSPAARLRTPRCCYSLTRNWDKGGKTRGGSWIPFWAYYLTFINWNTLRCGLQGSRFVQLIHDPSRGARAPGEAVQVQPFLTSHVINIWARCQGSGVFISAYDTLERFICKYWC